MHSCTELLAKEADSPFVWFTTGAAAAVWWLKNPNSKLFWFAAGAGAATWWIKTPKPDLREWKRKRAQRVEQRRRASELMDQFLNPPPVPAETAPGNAEVAALRATVESLQQELQSIRAHAQKPASESASNPLDDEDQLSEESIVHI